MTSILYSTMIMISFIFMQMTHPLAMGLMIILQTMMTCLLIGTMTKTFWFSYILFMIFIGGMLVLFIYVTSLASNEMFSMSMKSVLYSMMIIAISLYSIWLYSNNMTAMLWENNDMLQAMTTLNEHNDLKINLVKLFNTPTNWMTVILINYLFITLIAVVKISNLFFGPLRLMT